MWTMSYFPGFSMTDIIAKASKRLILTNVLLQLMIAPD